MPSISGYNQLFAAAGAKYGVDPRLLGAIVSVESGGNPAAVSPAGAQGLAQFMPQTAKSLGINPLIPSQAINGEAELIAQNLARYHNPEEAVAAYHGGTDQANWGPLTRDYVQKVAKAYQDMGAPAPATQTQASPQRGVQGPFTMDMLEASAQPKAPAATAPQSQSAPASAPQGAVQGPFTMDMLEASAKAPPAPKQGGLLDNLKAGALDTLRVPGEALDNALHGTIVGNALNVPSAAQDQAFYDRQTANLGNSLGDRAARFVGQIGVAAPVLATGEGAIGAGLDAAGSALASSGGELAGTAGNIVRGAGRLLTGKAGAFTGEGASGVGTKVASLAAQGAAQGAAYNALTGRAPVPGAELGALSGPVLAGAGSVVSGAAGNALNGAKPAAIKAATQVYNALIADGKDPAEAAANVGLNDHRLINLAGAKGDEGAANLSALAQAIANKPGVARQAIVSTLGNQTANAPAMLAKGVMDATGASGDVHELEDAVTASQKAASAPAYKKAFEGGSIAPLEDQFQQHFAEAGAQEAAAQKEVVAAKNALTLATARQTTTGGDVYSTSGANRAAREAQQQLQQAESALQTASANKAALLERLRAAQEDRTANKPGAVWSPRIQQFLDDPVMREGLKHGMALERLDALAEGRPFDPSEYAITGADQDGSPIVGKVPNMRLLDAGKRGLDAIIKEHTNDFGQMDQYGRAVNNVRAQYLNHLDALNPDYAVARAAYAGPAKVKDAINLGRNALKDESEVTARQIQNMSPSEKDGFKAGITHAIIKQITNSPDGRNVAAKIFGSIENRNRIAAAFDDPEEFEKFADLAKAVGQKYASRNEVIGNSATALRQASQGHNWGKALLHAGVDAAAGAPHMAAINLGGALVDHAANQGKAAVEAEVANLLTSPDRAYVQNALTQAAPGAVKRGAKAALSGGGKLIRLYAAPSQVQPQNQLTYNP